MSWICYLLEANFYLVIFYLLYYFIFRNETYYQFNRAYLLLSSLLAFVIPFLQLGFLKAEPAPIAEAVTTKIYLPSAPAANVVVVSHAWSFNDYCLALYLLIVGVLFINLSVKVYKLIRLSRDNRNTAIGAYKLVETNGEHEAFSFFNYLFINPKLAFKQTIIHHELIHVKQKHSWDIIYTELIKIINWFNPMVYLLQHSIKELHEFIADRETVELENNTLVYTDFLVNNVYGVNGNVLTNSFFNKSLIKKRIIMLHQERSHKSARLKYLLALPLIVGLLCLSTITFSKDYGLIDLVPAKNKPIEDNAISSLNGNTAGYVSNPKTHTGTRLFKITAALPKKNYKNSIKDNAVSSSNSNIVGYVIDPKTYTGAGLFKIAAALYKKGYKMDFNESYDATQGGPLLEVSIKSLPGTGWERETGGSATFRVNELKEHNLIIYVGANKTVKRTYVRSDTKDLTTQKQMDAISTLVQNKVADTNKSHKLPPMSPFMPVKKDFDGLSAYFAKTIRYPKEAKENKITGSVIDQFDLDDNHKITNIIVRKGIGYGCDEATVRLLKSYPVDINAKPGRYKIAVTFAIDELPAPTPASNQLSNDPEFIGEVVVTGYLTAIR